MKPLEAKKEIMKKPLIYIFIWLVLVSQSCAYRPMRDTIPLGLNEQNTNFVQTIFNKTDTLTLNFDTGATELVLTDKTIENKLQSAVSLYEKEYNLKIGKTTYKTPVYNARLTGHGTDGRFGWDLFEDKVVEIDYDNNIMVIHSKLPKKIRRKNTYSKLPIKALESVFTVQGQLKQGKTMVTHDFLFDTGYQRTAMLDNDLLDKAAFPVNEMEEIKRVMMRGAKGNEIPVITSNLQSLKLGDYELKNVPIQQMTTSRPIADHKVHYLGNEVIKRFHCFMDFPNRVIYIKPNNLFHETYIESK